MKPFWKTVLLTWLLVGTTDITAAYVHQFVITGKFAGKMLQYIAGGALGLENSMKGGFWVIPDIRNINLPGNKIFGKEISCYFFGNNKELLPFKTLPLS